MPKMPAAILSTFATVTVSRTVTSTGTRNDQTTPRADGFHNFYYDRNWAAADWYIKSHHHMMRKIDLAVIGLLGLFVIMYLGLFVASFF
jgi:hypothetical protein